jgi:TRAP-type C4-dicarboxylate transport system substrate-binding protein
LIAVAICLVAGPAAGEPHVVRMACIVPDGSGFARELKAMANEMQTASQGRVHVKLYLGAVAGDELEMLARIRRGQLDGMASAGMACEQLSPSLKVMRMPALFDSREDVHAVLSRLKAIWDKEFLGNGFRNLGETLIGPAFVFARHPDRSLEDLRRHVWWVWDSDRMMANLFPALGIKTLSLPIHEAARAYEAGKVDGFTITPSAALAFQWSSTAKYYINLPLAYVTGCLAMSSRLFDALDIADQQALLSAAAKAVIRIEDVARETDRQLMNGLFKRQGLLEVKPDERFRQQYRDAARQARHELARSEVPQALLDQVEGLLVEAHGHLGR